MALGLENQITTLTEDPGYFDDNSRVTYYGKGAPYVTKDKNVLMVWSGSNVSESVFETYSKGITGKLTGPGVDGEKQLTSTGVVTFSTNRLIYWNDVSFTKEGTYTLELSKDGQTIATINFEVIKVTFHAGTHGEFKGSASTFEWVGYGLKNNYLSKFDVPELTIKDGEGEFYGLIGWSAEDKGESGTYSDTKSKVSDLNGSGLSYDAYAVYGKLSVTSYKFSDENGNDVDYHAELKLGPAEYGYNADNFSKTITITNTGNQKIEFSLGTSGNNNNEFELSLDHPDLNGKEIGKLTIKPKAGLGLGTHKLSFILFAGRNPNNMSVTFEVTAKNVTVKVNEDIHKPYGTLMESVDPSKITVVTEGVQFEDLGVKISSPGFSTQAEVQDGGYPFELTGGNSNYNVTLAEDSGRVMVTPAEPRGEVTASGVLVNSKLSDSTLTGTFSHPEHSDWLVTGTLSWDESKNAGSTVLGETDSTTKYAWVFTPTGNDEKNYKSVTGETTVVVSPKTPTRVYPKNQINRFEYNGEPHGMSFTSDRQSEKGEITVQYRLLPGGAWTTDEPIDAGVYEVYAVLKESDSYAMDDDRQELTIVAHQIAITYHTEDKTYDGNTEAKADVAIKNGMIYQRDEGRVKINKSAIRASFEDANAGKDKNVSITNVTLTGDRAGNYYVLPDHRDSANITPKLITVALDGSAPTKEYGKERTLTEADYKFTDLLDPDSANAVFLCQGQAYDAPVAAYDVTVEVQNSNYFLVNNVISNGLIVTKATPELLEETLDASDGYKGGKLSDVSVAGTFVNPNRRDDMVVEGTFSWVNGNQELPDDQDSFTAEWQFTPKDTDNYNTPKTDTVEITLLDKKPISFTVTDKVCPYTGDGQGFTRDNVTITEDAIDPNEPNSGNIDKAKIELQFEYRLHQELATVALTADAWTTKRPVDAGIYDVQVTALAGPYGDTRADNHLIATLTIQKAQPDTSGVASSLTVAQDTPLDELTGELGTVKGVKEEELAGTFTWVESGTVKQAGTYHWSFTPESGNYESVHGSVTIELAPDERVLTADVYNLPDGQETGDYAVVKCKNGTLKADEIITIYNAAGSPVGVAEVKADDAAKNSVVVKLDADALGDDATTLTARISSSTMHQGNEIASPAELDVEVEENVTAYVGYEQALEAALKGYDAALVESVTFTVNEGKGESITVEDGMKQLEAAITGLAKGHSHVELQVVLRHPDTTLHPNETITITKTIHVTVEAPTGDLTVTKTVAGSQGDKNKDFKFRVTLTAPAAEEGGDNEPETVKYGDVEFTDGVGEFTLRHGQSVSITGIPEKTKYVVEELDADGYTVTKSGDKGEVGLLTKDTAAFTNTKGTVGGSGSGGGNGAPETGDDRHPGLWLGLLALCLGGIAVSVPVLRRRRGTR